MEILPLTGLISDHVDEKHGFSSSQPFGAYIYNLYITPSWMIICPVSDPLVKQKQRTYKKNGHVEVSVIPRNSKKNTSVDDI